MKKRRLFKNIIISILLVSSMISVTVKATSSTQQQLHQAEEHHQDLMDEKSDMEDDKTDVQGQLSSYANTQASYQEQLRQFTASLEDATNNLTSLEKQIVSKENEIDVTEGELEEAIAIRDTQYEAMKKRLQSSYEMSQSAYLELLLSKQTLGEILNTADYINQMAAYDDKKMEEYMEITRQVEEKKANLLAEREELENLHTQAELEKERIAGLVKTAQENVDAYNAKISEAQGELNQINAQIQAKEAEIAASESDIEALKKKYEEELALSRLAAQSAHRDISEVSIGDGDRYLLANLIYCEAGGEPYEGKLAVASVVMNRVLSSCYPDTISGVIYQNKQFSPVASGRLALALARGDATDSCYQAADEAMSGVNNIGTCVYFRTPIEGLTGTQIGGHIFY